MMANERNVAKMPRTAKTSRRATTRTPPTTGTTEANKARPGAVKAAAKTKPKLVRDSFTIPKAEYAILQGLKDRAANLKRPTKKSELLRAGVAALHAMSDRAFLSTLKSTPSLKTGRPQKEPLKE